MAESEPGSVPDHSRRLFARRQWRRRLRLWRRFVAGALVLGLVAFGVWAVYGSSWLSVKGVDVAGLGSSDTLTAAEVTTAARVPTGGALATVDLGAIRARVAALEEVRSVDVSREWPDRVRIAVTERVPVAVVRIGSGLHALDAGGVVFRDYRRAPTDLPLVVPDADASPAALREGAEVVSALPDTLAATVRQVDVSSVDDIRLELRDGREVEWGSSADSADKALVIAALLSQPGHRYDVSVPGQPTVH